MRIAQASLGFVFSISVCGLAQTPGVPQTILAPVVGPLVQVNTNIPIPVNSWQFNQHMMGFHHVGGGVAAADDTYAWDANFYQQGVPGSPNDLGQPVFAVEEGDVVAYGGSAFPISACHPVLIAHPSAANPVWWSGYLHMEPVLVAVGDHVTRQTQIGKIQHACVDNDHLHFVVYDGTNTKGGLRSRNATIVPRGCAYGTATSFLVKGLPPVHPNGSFLISVDDPTRTVYLVRGSDQHSQQVHRDGIATVDAFKNPYNIQGNSGDQFDFSEVITVSAAEMGSYPIGGVISAARSLPQSNSTKLPDGKLIQNQAGEISIVTDDGHRRPFAKQETFLGLGYAFCKVAHLNDSDYNSYAAESLVDGTANGSSVTLTVRSSYPADGLGAAVSPLDITGQGTAVTGFNLNYMQGTNVSITVPSATDNSTFSKWQMDGVDYHATQLPAESAALRDVVPHPFTVSSISTTVPMDKSHTLVAIYSPIPPVIASISPASGAIGSTVTILGSAFVNVSGVTLNGVPMPVYAYSDSSNQLIVTVPPGAVSGAIKVTTDAGSTVSGQTFVVLGTGISIATVAPAQGNIFDPVILTGTGLSNVTGVLFNGVAAQVQNISSTQISTAVPDHATTGLIEVRNTIGSVYSPNVFTVLPPTISNISPTSGSSGTSFYINGTGFWDATAVLIGNASAPILSRSSTQLAVSVPVNAATALVTVQSPSGQVESSVAFYVTQLPLHISSFTPASGTANTYVDIFGAGFSGLTSLYFQGFRTGFSIIDDSHITTLVPAGACSGPISVSGPGAQTSSATNFAIISPPPLIAYTNPLNTVPGGTIDIWGSNLGCVSAVTIDGIVASFGVLTDSRIFSIVPLASSAGNISLTTPWGSASGSVVVTLPPKPDFSLDVAPGYTSTQSITSGQMATFNIRVKSLNNFDGMLTVGCTGMPVGSTCVSVPANAHVTANQSLDIDVQIQTLQAAVANHREQLAKHDLIYSLFFALCIPGFLAVRRRTLKPLICLIPVSLIVGISSCSGASSPVKTPKTSTYSGSITISSGTIQHSLPITLNTTD